MGMRVGYFFFAAFFLVAMTSSGVRESKFDSIPRGRPPDETTSVTQRRTTHFCRHNAPGANVSPPAMSPLSKPFRNHLTRWAEVPCVNESGVTVPVA